MRSSAGGAGNPDVVVKVIGDDAYSKRASASRLSGEWNDDDYDVLANGALVGRVLKVHAAPVGTPWMWTLPFGHPTRTARRRTAMSRRARLPWLRSRKAGGESIAGWG
jgi:hypothetical protein